MGREAADSWALGGRRGQVSSQVSWARQRHHCPLLPQLHSVGSEKVSDPGGTLKHQQSQPGLETASHPTPSPSSCGEAESKAQDGTGTGTPSSVLLGTRGRVSTHASLLLRPVPPADSKKTRKAPVHSQKGQRGDGEGTRARSDQHTHCCGGHSGLEVSGMSEHTVGTELKVVAGWESRVTHSQNSVSPISTRGADALKKLQRAPR